MNAFPKDARRLLVISLMLLDSEKNHIAEINKELNKMKK